MNWQPKWDDEATILGLPSPGSILIESGEIVYRDEYGNLTLLYGVRKDTALAILKKFKPWLFDNRFVEKAEEIAFKHLCKD